MEETGLILETMMPKAPQLTTCNFEIYNPGTEKGHSVIRFAGKTGDYGLTIRNSTTGDVCKLQPNIEITDGAELEIDSKSGRVILHDDEGSTLSFMYHDEGYITFEPCRPLYENIHIQTTEGSRDIYCPEGVFTEDMKGKYVYLDGIWRYIGRVASSTNASLNVTVHTTGTQTTKISNMNYLTILAAHDADITQLEIICKPEVR